MKDRCDDMVNAARAFCEVERSISRGHRYNDLRAKGTRRRFVWKWLTAEDRAKAFRVLAKYNIKPPIRAHKVTWGPDAGTVFFVQHVQMNVPAEFNVAGLRMVNSVVDKITS